MDKKRKRQQQAMYRGKVQQNNISCFHLMIMFSTLDLMSTSLNRLDQVTRYLSVLYGVWWGVTLYLGPNEPQLDQIGPGDEVLEAVGLHQLGLETNWK